jgi:serine/threonine protein kinase
MPPEDATGCVEVPPRGLPGMAFSLVGVWPEPFARRQRSVRSRTGGPGVSLPPGTVVGKYVIQRKLAEGGMAEIFLATAQGAEGFEKPVVVKRIRSGLANDTSFVEMFIAEARLASRLSHPNLVHIFDFDRHEDSYYLAMEYIRGRSLLEAHRRASELGTPVPPMLVAQIGVEVARGLGYAHKLTDQGKPLNLVHRDVTPHNVLLSYEGAVKLTDFGIAKAGGRATTAGMLKGKFAYMAPEQARGDPVDSRTDLFSLGITLWELLTGSRLFDGDTDMAVLRAVQERPVLPPAELNPAVDEELSGVIVKALERSPTNRFQTAAELERALLKHVLHKSDGPEDTDVGAFVRDLFPVESERAEAQVSPTPGSGVGRISSVSRPQSGVYAAGLASRSSPSGQHRTVPPAVLAAEQAAMGNTSLYDSKPPRPARDASQATQPAARDAYVEDGPTMRTPAPGRTRPVPRASSAGLPLAGARAAAAKLLRPGPARAVLLVVVAALLSIVAATILGKRGEEPAAPVTARPLALDLGRPVPTPVPPPAEPASIRAASASPSSAETGGALGEGFLEVSLASPGTVTIDGKDALLVDGTHVFSLRPGHHEVMVTNSKVIFGDSVTVKPGVTVRKHYAFTKRK